MHKALNYAKDPYYTEFIRSLKSGIKEHGLSRPNTVVVDWLRLGGGKGFIISKEGQKKLYTIATTDRGKKINCAEVITISNNTEDQSNSLKKELGKILCNDDATLDFLGNYASQNGFLESSGFTLARFFTEKGLSINPKQNHWFEVLDNKIVLHTTIIVNKLFLVGEIYLENPIEIEASIEILTGQEISDEGRLVNPKVEYFGSKREAELTRQSSQMDSGLSSEVSSDTESQDDTYNLSSLFSQDTASGDQDSGIDSERSSVSGDHSSDGEDRLSQLPEEDSEIGINSNEDNFSKVSKVASSDEVESDEESIIIDGMIFFHNDFKPLIHNKTTSEDLKDATDCFKELDNHFSPNGQGENLSQFLEGMKVGTISGLEVATLYYQDWTKGEGRGQNFHNYVQKNKEEHQPIITTCHRYYDVDGMIQTTQNKPEVVIKTLSHINQNGGVKAIHDHQQQKIQDLKHLRNNGILSLAASTSVLILSSAICVMSVLEQTGKMSTNFLSVAKGFSAPANIAILGSIALLTIISGLTTGYMLNRVSERTEEINKVEGKFSSKVLEGATTSMAR